MIKWEYVILSQGGLKREQPGHTVLISTAEIRLKIQRQTTEAI